MLEKVWCWSDIEYVSLMELLGFALVPGDAIPSLLRLRHLRRTRSTAGLSPFTNAQWMVSWWLWALYALLIDSVPLLIVSVITAFVDTCIVVVLVYAKAMPMRTLLSVTLGGVALGAVGVLTSPELIAAVVTVVDFVAYLPQVRLALREADLSGISVPAWAFALVQDAGWIVYGFGTGHPLLAGWALVSAPASVMVLVLAVRKSRIPPAESGRGAPPSALD